MKVRMDKDAMSRMHEPTTKAGEVVEDICAIKRQFVLAGI
jgi:hypothetical protein